MIFPSSPTEASDQAKIRYFVKIGTNTFWSEIPDYMQSTFVDAGEDVRSGTEPPAPTEGTTSAGRHYYPAISY